MITDEQLREFQLLYEKQFGETIDKQEALSQAIKLIELVRVLYYPKKPKKNDTIPSLQ